MSYSSRYMNSYSSRYGDNSSSRHGDDSTSRYGRDSMKDYTSSYSSSRYGDYSSRYGAKDNDYLSRRGTYSSRRLQTCDGSDEDDQRATIEKADIEDIENAKYFGQSDKAEETEECEENPVLEVGKNENIDDEEKEVHSLTCRIQNSEEQAEDEELGDATSPTLSLTASSPSPTQTVEERDSITPTYQKTTTKGKLVTTPSEHVGPPITKVFNDDSIPKKKVSDLIAKFNAKCEMDNSQNHADGWKQKHEFRGKTVGKIQSTMFH
uniref:Putative myelin transcription factor 1-like n=1 Tax=Angiostrongylus cantonensis TaxID=6313 RepID=C7BVS6_ANGCA|nr:putative myelin transcription factor 1-like [Angiostrongylus cantonensis]